jgi:hypothetical protein
VTLRLIKPSTGGQRTRPPKGRRAAALFITDEEAQHFRATVRNAARAYGGFPVLAEVVGVPVATLHQAVDKKNRRPSGILVIRVAKAAGMSVEAIIGPALFEAGRCKACGARVGHAADRRAP